MVTTREEREKVLVVANEREEGGIQRRLNPRWSATYATLLGKTAGTDG